LITEAEGTPGGWDDMHGWSKFAGGEGVMSLLTGGASKAASVVDDAGRCDNWFTKFVHGGCFVAGTKVTVSELPYPKARESQVWSETEWLSNKDYSYSPSPRFQGGEGEQELLMQKPTRHCRRLSGRRVRMNNSISPSQCLEDKGKTKQPISTSLFLEEHGKQNNLSHHLFAARSRTAHNHQSPLLLAAARRRGRGMRSFVIVLVITVVIIVFTERRDFEPLFKRIGQSIDIITVVVPDPDRVGWEAWASWLLAAKLIHPRVNSWGS
jgi:hypothetical protein